jgi:DNA-binding transcriptional MerR regulator
MSIYTIKDLERLSGVKAHTIRIWEQRYSFLKPKRSVTNIRFYSADEVKALLNVALLNKHGYKISHIVRMNETEAREKILSLTGQEVQLDRKMNQLIFLMIQLDMEEFEIQLDNVIAQNGINDAILHLIFPFLERIGVLWLTDHINPAQEHLVSNIIRQKLLVGINSLEINRNKIKTVILFLPEGELHEMGLLYVYYLLKKRGIGTLYLGANLPLADLKFVARLKRPDYIITHLTTKSISLQKFLQNYKKSLAGIPLVVSGKVTEGVSKKMPAGITICGTLQQLTDLVAAF